MRKAILLANVICFVIFTKTFGQPTFPLKFKSTFPVDAKWRIHNNDLTIAVAGNLQELAGMDLTTGKILWNFSFKDKLGVKKVNDWNFDKEINVVTIQFNSDTKGKEEIKRIDAINSLEIDDKVYAELKAKKQKKETIITEHSENKNAEKKKGRVFKSSLKHNGNFIQISYDKKLLTGAKNTKTTTATVTCSGKVTWKKEIVIQVIRPLCSISFSSSTFGGDFLDVTAYKDKLFVLYEGITVMDINTGEVLWSTGFNNSKFDFGIFKSTQELGRAAWPLPTEDFVYVVDLNDYERCIKKLDIHNGSLIWRSEKFGKDAVIPEIQLIDNILFVKCGGKIEKQTYIPGVEGKPDVCKKEFKYSGDFGLKAIDVNTGKTIWQTFNNNEIGDKFSSQITNIFINDNKVFLGSDKNIFCFNASDGKVLFKKGVSELKIGKPYEIWEYNQMLMIQADKGIAAISPTDGSQKWVSKTKMCISSFFVDEAFFIINGKSEEVQDAFIRLDLNNGKIIGGIKNTTYPYFTNDGSEFIKYDKQKVLRYITK